MEAFGVALALLACAFGALLRGLCLALLLFGAPLLLALLHLAGEFCRTLLLLVALGANLLCAQGLRLTVAVGADGGRCRNCGLGQGEITLARLLDFLRQHGFGRLLFQRARLRQCCEANVVGLVQAGIDKKAARALVLCLFVGCGGGAALRLRTGAQIGRKFGGGEGVGAAQQPKEKEARTGKHGDVGGVFYNLAAEKRRKRRRIPFLALASMFVR